tara:strand:+ start:12659 stop:12832 length:174 start_codon:yes stop_codon:yes gene_type:complete
MNRTQVIGGALFVIGFMTHSKFENNPAGTILLFISAFLIWNGWVASYNEDINFAIFG